MSFSLGMSKLAGIIGDIIGAIFKPLSDLLLDIVMKTLAIIPQLLYMIFACIAQIADVVQILFRLLAGMSDSMIYINENALGHINGKPTGNFILDILMSRVVMSVFSKMLVVAVILLLVFTFVAIIKNEYSSEGSQNSKGKIVGKSLKALLTFLFIPVLCLAGIMISNGLLNTLDGASANGATGKISARIFVSAAYNANRIRSSGDVNAANTMGYIEAGDSYIEAAELVDGWFGNGSTVKAKNGDASADISKYTFWGPLGRLENGQNGSSRTFTILDTGAVFHYYDLWGFNYILGFVAIAFITLTFVSLLLGLAKRAIDLAILFVISPPIVAVMPLDNGQMFGKWKTEFVKRVLNTYAPVVAMNLYLVLIPHFMNVDIFRSVLNSYETDFMFSSLALLAETGAGEVAAQMASNVLAVMVNSVFQIVMILSGAVAVKSSIDWISDLIGAENLAKTSKEMNDGTKAMGVKAAAVGLRGAQVVGAGIKGAAKLTGAGVKLGGKALGGVAKFTGGMLGAAGKGIANSKFGQAVGKKARAAGAAIKNSKFGKGVQRVGQGIGNGVTGAAKWVGGKFTAFGSAVGTKAKQVGTAVKESKFGKAMLKVGGGIGKGLKAFGATAKDVGSKSFKGLGDEGKNFGKVALSGAKGLGGAFANLGKTMAVSGGLLGIRDGFMENYDKKGFKEKQTLKEFRARDKAQGIIDAEKKKKQADDDAKAAQVKADEIKATKLQVDNAFAAAQTSADAANSDQDSKYLQEVAAGIKRMVENGTGSGSQYGQGYAKILAEVKAGVEIKTKAQVEQILNDEKLKKAVAAEVARMSKKSK